MTREVQAPPDVTPLTEAIDYRRCPRCGSTETLPSYMIDLRMDGFDQKRNCMSCREFYIVTFRAVTTQPPATPNANGRTVLSSPTAEEMR